MAEDSSSAQERSEQPTPRRRAQAHEQGRVPRSPELSSATVLLAGAAVVAVVGVPVFGALTVRLLHESTRALASPDPGGNGLLGFLADSVREYLGALAVFSGGLIALVVLVNAVQARGVLSLQPITPKWSHVDPMQGLRRVFSMDSVVNGAKAVAKLAAIGLVMWHLLAAALPGMFTLASAGPEDTAAVIRHLALRLAVVLGLSYLVIAAADYAWQRYRHEKGLRMTRQEVIYEHRDSEGNPHVKARMLSFARSLARRRMLQKVPAADVIVVNPTRIAVALKYDTSLAAAPIVVAMGQRKLAERIRDIARRAGVPIVENRPVARALLATGKVGRPIPAALYAAVAEILAFVYRRRNLAAAALGRSA